MHLLTQAKNKVSALELKCHLGVRYKAAWLIKRKLLQVMYLREELFEFHAGRAATGDRALVGGTAGSDRLQAPQPVGDNLGRRALRKAFNRRPTRVAGASGRRRRRINLVGLNRRTGGGGVGIEECKLQAARL